MDAVVVIVFVVVTFLEWYHVGGLLSTRISPESDYDNLRGVPNGSTSVNINVKFATSPIFTDVGPDRDMSGCDVGED
ncbi:hypothetical protein DPMN_121642 [Dreissena polymorpha]|uniref:Uncharacterized protein n=1 Tax=Dreissena polymorpha TaxID=45954 RepID=A0A9D4GQG3_DREPO|nr:hypothetical protein DPMN_121642 [Dreissena polymorpha]